MKLKIKLLLIMIITNILLHTNFDKLASENFAARLKQENLAIKLDIPDITDFVKKTDFHDKLKKLNKIVTSNKTSHTEFNTKLDDLEKEAKITPTIGLTADLINKSSIINGAKQFSLKELKTYLFFQLFINYFFK